ncbi:hypothetical protein Cch01nite_37430 [Cellulomonas chitinilytica]|uniref:Uncharacterized protein n=1 Tax=Cellulomonas chitinilytica TaxID=398759 RepID=A0A919U4D0_9CELL|nr:hypothetical protein Cch01nite_37430 [Cellulomonas chitinilytica]
MLGVVRSGRTEGQPVLVQSVLDRDLRARETQVDREHPVAVEVEQDGRVREPGVVLDIPEQPRAGEAASDERCEAPGMSSWTRASPRSQVGTYPVMPR